MDLNWMRGYIAPVLALSGVIAISAIVLDLIPPKELTLASGRPGGAFFDTAERYRAILARDGINVTVLDTAGSVENAELLASGVADAALLQGGIDPPPEAGIEALATIFLEPLWVFHGGKLEDPSDPDSWRNLRLAAGEDGSGTRYVSQALIEALGLAEVDFRLIPIGGADAAAALMADEVDAAFFVAPVTAPYLQPLFETRSEVLSELRDGEALARQLPYVRMVDIPRSGIDYVDQFPEEPIELIAMVGRLAAQGHLHPALVDRLVNAAKLIHSDRDLISNDDQFPGFTGASLPMNAQAKDLLTKGPGPFAHVLPYWVTAQISSFALLLLPVLFLLLPLIRMGPFLYQWRMNARVWRHYGDLLDIDREMLTQTDPDRLRELSAQLDVIERDLISLRLPLRFRDRAYTTRLHIEMVRKRIDAILSS